VYPIDTLIVIRFTAVLMQHAHDAHCAHCPAPFTPLWKVFSIAQHVIVSSRVLHGNFHLPQSL
jgi:hypothetical protein